MRALPRTHVFRIYLYIHTYAPEEGEEKKSRSDENGEAKKSRKKVKQDKFEKARSFFVLLLVILSAVFILFFSLLFFVRIFFLIFIF